MTDFLRNQQVVLGVCIVAGLFGIFTTRWLFMAADLTGDKLVGDTPSPDLLSQHSAEFKQQILKVTDGVYVAIGYALANSILIEAPEGAIVVDTTESMEAGREVYAAFRNVTQSPIKVIVYTHNHADHLYGTSAFINASSPPEIWAHHTLPALVDATSVVLPLTYARATRQFGNNLREVAPKAFRNSGIGPYLRINRHTAAVQIRPTHLMYGDTQNVTMAGLPVTLVHIPGETTDQIGVWVPSKGTFLCADDLYRTFPNLYAIRGTPTRDTLLWVSSLDKVLSYEPEYLVPSHSQPLRGWTYIRSVLTDYRDAIKLVHDQTVRYMNKGMVPDDIVTKVHLPESLIKSPFLQTFYGTVEWSVRGVFDRYMGWFSGNILELSRYSTYEKAKRMLTLAGGREKMLHKAKDAAEEKDFRWALELATHVLMLNKGDTEAKAIRLIALKGLASEQVSANGRNYYLSIALEDYGLADGRVPISLQKAAIMFMKPKKMFEMLTLRLKAEEVEGVNVAAAFVLTDIHEVYMLRIRNSVMDVVHGVTQGWTIKVTVSYELWKGIIAGKQSALSLYMSGSLQVEGGMLEFKRFMGYFDTE